MLKPIKGPGTIESWSPLTINGPGVITDTDKVGFGIGGTDG